MKQLFCVLEAWVNEDSNLVAKVKTETHGEVGPPLEVIERIPATSRMLPVAGRPNRIQKFLETE